MEVLTKLNLHVVGLNVAPVGYIPSGNIHSSNEESAAAQDIQVSMGTDTEFSANQPRAHQVLPRDVVPQKIQGDPKDVYQGSRMPNVGPGANPAISQNGEAHHKFKTI
ncbi:hypothetical protein A2U01_0053333 [Trifolium medium]|uniref:Uncharacterized protein n=1 Tax=Trifolium medium TaxID=97028 RepID=A0A392R696_9FABA|nr:hypothetical protein [Trifolium medium]